jgi:hypothetical protein
MVQHKAKTGCALNRAMAAGICVWRVGGITIKYSKCQGKSHPRGAVGQVGTAAVVAQCGHCSLAARFVHVDRFTMP